MDILTKLFSQIFDRFKAQNPVMAAAMVAALIGFAYFLSVSGEDVFGSSFNTILQWVNWILLGLQGSRTTQILTTKTEADK